LKPAYGAHSAMYPKLIMLGAPNRRLRARARRTIVTQLVDTKPIKNMLMVLLVIDKVAMKTGKSYGGLLHS